MKWLRLANIAEGVLLMNLKWLAWLVCFGSGTVQEMHSILGERLHMSAAPACRLKHAAQSHSARNCDQRGEVAMLRCVICRELCAVRTVCCWCARWQHRAFKLLRPSTRIPALKLSKLQTGPLIPWAVHCSLVLQHRAVGHVRWKERSGRHSVQERAV